MTVECFAGIVRGLARRFYDRRVWVGEQGHVSGMDKAVDRLLSFAGFTMALAWVNHRDTAGILKRFPEVAPDAGEHPMLWLVPEALRAEWTSVFIDLVTRVQRQRPQQGPPGSAPSAFSVIIPFFAHLRYLESCLESVQRAARQAPGSPLEIIIVNDDPDISLKAIERAIPKPLFNKTRLLQNVENLGICATLNRAVSETRHPWILHLDCDDRISAECLAVLSRRIRQYPGVRYISSRMLDIDADGGLLRVRLRKETPSMLMTRGMVAGHLKVIRRDLFTDIGPYREAFAGCQDYEFALRAGLFEPLLFIPDYLYEYRWHGSTQSVAQARRQARTTWKIIDAYLLAGRMLTAGRPPMPLSFQGPASGQWNRAYPEGNKGKGGLAIEVHRPLNAFNQRLLAINASCHWVERHYTGASLSPLVY